MKKFLALSIVVFLSLPLAADAAVIGAAETLGQGELSIGLGQEVVFARKMKDVSIPDDAKVKLRIDRAYRTMIKAGYGLLDNLDIYARLGIAKFDVKQMEFFGTQDGIGKKKGKNALAYGFGAKGAIFLVNYWLIGLDVQYLRHRNKFDYRGETVLLEGNGKMTFQKWHVAPYIARELDQFTPYLGVRYSDIRVKSRGEFEGEFEFELPCNWKSAAKRNVGVFVGTDFEIDENWKLNIEGRFLDETAMSMGATYKF